MLLRRSSEAELAHGQPVVEVCLVCFTAEGVSVDGQYPELRRESAQRRYSRAQQVGVPRHRAATGGAQYHRGRARLWEGPRRGQRRQHDAYARGEESKRACGASFARMFDRRFKSSALACLRRQRQACTPVLCCPVSPALCAAMAIDTTAASAPAARERLAQAIEALRSVDDDGSLQPLLRALELPHRVRL